MTPQRNSPSEPPSRDRPVPPGVLRILLADDDAVDRMAVTRALKQASIDAQIVEVEGADEALEALVSDGFDCALLDFQMPKRDGLWVLVEARARGVETPVIMLTGQGDEQTAVDLIKAGASDYIPKSALSPKRLRGSVHQAVRLARAEQKLRASERERERQNKLVQTIADNATSALYFVDERGLCTFMNRAAEGLVGHGTTDVGGRDLHDLLHPGGDGPGALCPGAACEIARAMRRGERCVSAEAVFARRDGSTFAALVSTSPIVEDDAQTGTVVEVRDVTEQREREAEARRRAEFEQQLVAIVSHDLRNPLQVIQLSANFLLRSEGIHERFLKPLRRVAATSERMARMIGELLDFTQARVGGGIPLRPVRGDLHELARQVVDEANVAHPGRTVTFEQTGGGFGLFDGDRVQQVLVNLVENAVSHSPEGTRVSVLASSEGAEISVAVHNEGDPIPVALRGVLFEPYRRGEGSTAKSKSVGLGLYIVDQIVRAHGGAVDVTSTEEAGTTFTVRLPREASAPRR